MARATKTLNQCRRNGRVGFVGTASPLPEHRAVEQLPLVTAAVPRRRRRRTGRDEAIEATNCRRLFTRRAPAWRASNSMNTLCGVRAKQAAIWLDGVAQHALENRTPRASSADQSRWIPKSSQAHARPPRRQGVGARHAGGTGGEDRLSLLPVGHLEVVGARCCRPRRVRPQLDSSSGGPWRPASRCPRLARLGDRLRPGRQARCHHRAPWRPAAARAAVARARRAEPATRPRNQFTDTSTPREAYQRGPRSSSRSTSSPKARSIGTYHSRLRGPALVVIISAA